MEVVESIIYLENVRFHAYHGVLPQERIAGGDYIISVKVKYPYRKALQTDDVSDTLDYSQLYEIINKEMQKPSNLLEHLAGRIGKSIKAQFPLAEEAWLKITKCNPPMGGCMDGAGVEIRLNYNKSHG
ncbi:MAG: dihydroneopterin aldolase [Prevotella sp.]|nr:dihydroneopterin aldolase [Prevotella sp.]MBR1462250.1 dihydroneopterin aldolase [Prevotella sp.]